MAQSIVYNSDSAPAEPVAQPKLSEMGEPAEGAAPELILGKFKSNEDLAAAYSALEKKYSVGGEKPAEPVGTSAEPEKLADVPAVDPEKPADTATFKYDDVSKEWADNGALSDKTYATLESNGFDKDTVDAFISYKQTSADAAVAKMLEPVGGAEGYAELTVWAKENLTASEIAAFDRMVTTGSTEEATLAVQGLNARRGDNKEPSLLSGKTGGKETGSDIYQSNEQMVKDMGDDRYKTDPAFRKMVADKIGRSRT